MHEEIIQKKINNTTFHVAHRVVSAPRVSWVTLHVTIVVSQ